MVSKCGNDLGAYVVESFFPRGGARGRVVLYLLSSLHFSGGLFPLIFLHYFSLSKVKNKVKAPKLVKS